MFLKHKEHTEATGFLSARPSTGFVCALVIPLKKKKTTPTTQQNRGSKENETVALST